MSDSMVKEEYIQVPVVDGPDVSSWRQGRLRWFRLEDRFGFVAGDSTTGGKDVLLTEANRVVPEASKGNRHTLDIRITLTGVKAPPWQPINMNQAVLYILGPDRPDDKLMAVPWCLHSDVLQFDVNTALQKQTDLFRQLPTFSIGRSFGEPEPEWYYRSNWPFRSLREWLVVEQRLKKRTGKPVCKIEINEGQIWVETYSELRQVVQSLPEALRSV